jgi:pilus assembly protein CpaB
MKIAVLSLVLLGVLAAACAAVLVTTLTSRGQGSAPVAKTSDDVEILIAARDLPPMTVIESGFVKAKKVPKAQVPQNALLNSIHVVGKVTVERMVSGQAFTKSCFPKEGTGVALAAALPPGKRAMSVTLSDWSGMAGLLYPGSVVDVLVSFKTLGVGKATGAEMKSTTLLQGLQVLAIGSQSIATDNYQDKNPGALSKSGQINTRMITLLVDTKQAEILQLAMQTGAISLAMRNPLDAAKESRRLTRAREISPDAGTFGVDSIPIDPFDEEAANQTAAQPTPDHAAAAAKGKADEWQTVIVRGSASETRTFPLPEAQSQQPASSTAHDETKAGAGDESESSTEAAPAGAGG